MTKRLSLFALAAAAIVGCAAWVVTALSGDAAADRAVWVSAVVAVVVQVGAFAVIWPIVTKNPMAGWGVGSIIRLVTLVLYGLVGARMFELPLGPALLSLAGFLFLTMIVEPFFLRR